MDPPYWIDKIEVSLERVKKNDFKGELVGLVCSRLYLILLNQYKTDWPTNL